MAYDYEYLDQVFENIPVGQLICFNVQSVLNCPVRSWHVKKRDIHWYATKTYYYHQADQAIKNGWPL